jgi:hypothetical protein
MKEYNLHVIYYPKLKVLHTLYGIEILKHSMFPERQFITVAQRKLQLMYYYYYYFYFYYCWM